MKIRRQRRFILLFFFVLCLVSVVIVWILHARPCSRLSCIWINGQTTWHIKEIYEENPGSIFRALYSGENDRLIRVDVRTAIDQETALDYVRGRVTGMQALYTNTRSPYPGVLSDEISCDEGFQPTYGTLMTQDGIPVRTITGYLNERLVFGACTKGQITHKAIMLLLFCSQHTQLYQIEFIEPVATFSPETYESLAKSIRCE